MPEKIRTNREKILHSSYRGTIAVQLEGESTWWIGKIARICLPDVSLRWAESVDGAVDFNIDKVKHICRVHEAEEGDITDTPEDSSPAEPTKERGRIFHLLQESLATGEEVTVKYMGTTKRIKYTGMVRSIKRTKDCEAWDYLITLDSHPTEATMYWSAISDAEKGRKEQDVAADKWHVREPRCLVRVIEDSSGGVVARVYADDDTDTTADTTADTMAAAAQMLDELKLLEKGIDADRSCNQSTPVSIVKLDKSYCDRVKAVILKARGE